MAATIRLLQAFHNEWNTEGDNDHDYSAEAEILADVAKSQQSRVSGNWRPLLSP